MLVKTASVGDKKPAPDIRSKRHIVVTGLVKSEMDDISLGVDNGDLHGCFGDIIPKRTEMVRPARVYTGDTVEQHRDGMYPSVPWVIMASVKDTCVETTI